MIRLPWMRDPHPYPHMMKDGGCCCSCVLCTKPVGGSGSVSLRCVCRRCDESCPGLGRLGTAAAVDEERKAGYFTVGTPASRWMRRPKVRTR